jgi:predicted nucleic acid-binding protein
VNVYLLDTNVLSELRRMRPHGGVMAWLRGIDERQLHLSAVSFGEIQNGIEMTRERDPTNAAELEAWSDRIAATWNVLPMDARSFRLCAKLMVRQSDTLSEDAMIAATARVHNLRVVTRNVRDFRAFGVEVFNPFAPA